MSQSRKVTDGALLLAVYIILMLIAIFVPVIMLIILFLLPIPFVIYASKYDWKPTLLMLGAAVILSLLFATVFSLPIAVFTGLGGLMIGMSIHHRLTPYETWARGTIGFIVGLLFLFLFTQSFLDINWTSEIDTMINESLQLSKELIEQFGLANEAGQEISMIEEQLLYITELIPAGLAIASIFMGLITQWISYKVINRLEDKSYSFPPVRKFKLPVTIVWIYFFALLFTLFDLNPDDFIYIVAMNVLVLVGLLITLQGFSFIFYFADYKNWSIAIPIVSIIITLLIPLLLLYFVRIIGIIDLGFGLRERLSKD